MNRAEALARLAGERFDVLVVGGGATGVGAALDAAARGYRTALIEGDDFAKATSSRSTKLVHGGVRYLRQGNVGLVREALRERGRLLANAPHLVRPLAFVVPAYRRWELAYYRAGLAAYDLLAGAATIERSRFVSAEEARVLVPALAAPRLRGGVVYADAQFDDARLALAIARSAADRGAAVANYVRAIGPLVENGTIAGVEARERESGASFPIRARATINATGIFVDGLRALADPRARPLLTYSRGSHLVVAPEALEARAALLVPRTDDGRVLFALPWHGRVVVGTTEVRAARAELDPTPSEDEIAYLLATVNRHLERPLRRDDVRAAFAGLRPLVDRGATSTAKLSREHLIEVAPSGLVSVAGGKWTTYRAMAEQAVDAAIGVAALAPAPSRTARLALHGAPDDGERERALRGLVGSEPSLGAPLDPRLPYTGAHVVYAAREEMARTVEDVLARRTRALFLDAEAAKASVPVVAALLSRELGRDVSPS